MEEIERKQVDLLVGQTLRLNAIRFPNKTALIYNGLSFTYSELNKRVNRLGNALLKMGLQKGDKVGIVSFNRNEYIELIFAIAKIGCVFVPIHYGLKGKEIEYIIDNSDAVFIFVEDLLINNVMEVRENLTKLKNVVILGDGEAPEGTLRFDDILATGSEEEPQETPQEQDTLVIIYTSGTTGLPKGAMQTQRSISLLAIDFAIEFGFRPNHTGLTAGPLFSAAGFAFTIPNLVIGGCVVLLHHFDPMDAIKLIDTYKINNVWFAPVMQRFIMLVPEEERNKYDMNSLEAVISVGSPLDPETRKASTKYFGEVCYSLYGAAEHGASTCIRPEDILKKPTSDGPNFLGMEMRVVDDNGNDVPQGEVGEFIVKGFTVCNGYYKKPEATRDAMVGDYLGLGDLGYQDEDGHFYVVDRKKDMIISGGTNVYPVEIEIMMKENKDIADVAVIGVPHEKWGEGVMAIVILKEGVERSTEEIMEWCKKNMAGYKCPKAIEFTTELPYTPSGKIMKYKLREKFSG